MAAENVVALTPANLTQKVIGLYALLAYDWSDFLSDLPKESTPVLEALLRTLEQPNDKHDASTRELNKFGADSVRSELERRK